MTDTPYQLIALDIDGTLLNSAHRLTETVRLALSRVARAGLHVVLVSARTPRSVLDFSRRIGPDGPAIALNGALVVASDGVIPYRSPMVEEDVQVILTLAGHYDLTVNLFTGFEWYVDRVNAWVEKETEIIGFGPIVVESLQGRAGQAEKILVMGEPALLQTFHRDLTRRATNLDAAFSKPFYCEITTLGVNKVTGLEYICRDLHISPSAVIAVGDNFNDVDMLKFAGLGVAMGNAPAAVKAIADLVIGSNDEDGVADFCAALDNFSKV